MYLDACYCMLLLYAVTVCCTWTVDGRDILYIYKKREKGEGKEVKRYI